MTNLREAATKYAVTIDLPFGVCEELRNAFVAGASWQREQDKGDRYEEIYASVCKLHEAVASETATANARFKMIMDRQSLLLDIARDKIEQPEPMTAEAPYGGFTSVGVDLSSGPDFTAYGIITGAGFCIPVPQEAGDFIRLVNFRGSIILICENGSYWMDRGYNELHKL